MKLRYMLIGFAACVVLMVALLAWFYPMTGVCAVARAKAKEVAESADTTYGDLISRYEEVMGTRGTWDVKRTGGDCIWEVTYAAPGIDPPLWFGVKTRMSGEYVNELSLSIVDRMLDTIASDVP